MRDTRAGATSCSTIKTPLDDALDEQDAVKIRLPARAGITFLMSESLTGNLKNTQAAVRFLPGAKRP